MEWLHGVFKSKAQVEIPAYDAWVRDKGLQDASFQSLDEARRDYLEYERTQLSYADFITVHR